MQKQIIKKKIWLFLMNRRRIYIFIFMLNQFNDFFDSNLSYLNCFLIVFNCIYYLGEILNYLLFGSHFVLSIIQSIFSTTLKTKKNYLALFYLNKMESENCSETLQMLFISRIKDAVITLKSF